MSKEWRLAAWSTQADQPNVTFVRVEVLSGERIRRSEAFELSVEGRHEEVTDEFLAAIEGELAAEGLIDQPRTA